MKKILVIDDEEWLREMVQMALSQRGYDVVEAENGAVGIEKARKELPDLILCDVNMEKVDGYHTLSSLRNEPATAAIPFILMTGLADNAGMRHGMELGADDYLPKPFTIDGLFAAVDARLKKAQTVRAEAERKLSDLRDNISMMLPHELRTPLNGILTFGAILQNDAATLQPGDITDMGETICESGRRLERLIENFLIYTQLELWAVDPQKVNLLRGTQTTDSANLIREHAQKQAGEAKRLADLQLSLGNVPVPMGAEYLAKVVDELVQNAFKFSKPGTVVRVTLAETPAATMLLVNDVGRGLSTEHIARVGAYMQFDRKEHEQQGLGLGLTIARRLTELHGGTLAIQSEPGAGTSVSVKLPKPAAN
jgi:signal transduction histidine kinase